MSLPALAIRACAVSALLVVTACQKAPDTAAAAPPLPAPGTPAVVAPAEVAPALADTAATPTQWPASLHVFGDGFPNAGDPCRRVGESEATNNFLDHTAALVGCQAVSDAEKLGGKIVATVDGITLVSVPQ
jgi:hypothetical protein